MSRPSSSSSSSSQTKPPLTLVEEQKLEQGFATSVANYFLEKCEGSVDRLQVLLLTAPLAGGQLHLPSQFWEYNRNGQSQWEFYFKNLETIEGKLIEKVRQWEDEQPKAKFIFVIEEVSAQLQNLQKSKIIAAGYSYILYQEKGSKTAKKIHCKQDHYYHGEVNDSHDPHGKGTEIILRKGRYVGEWEDGEMHGMGIYTFANGDEYVGGFQNGKKSGKGTFTRANGVIENGVWDEDEKEGGFSILTPGGSAGVIFYEDDEINAGIAGENLANAPRSFEVKRDSFVSSVADACLSKFENNPDFLIKFLLTVPLKGGDFHSDVTWESMGNAVPDEERVNFYLNNLTAIKDKMLGRIELLENANRNQKTVFTFALNEAFATLEKVKSGKPQILSDNIISYGADEMIIHSSDGCYYGQVKAGSVVMSGEGTKISSSGKYTGAWLDGQKNGEGTYAFANGDIYKGEFENNKFQGQGVYLYANGDIYDGHFADGKKHLGISTFTQADGTVFEGVWEDDQKEGLFTVTSPAGEKKFVTYSHGEIQAESPRNVTQSHEAKRVVEGRENIR